MQPPPNEYQIDTEVQLLGTFANATTGAPADPTTVTLYLEDPSGTVTTPTSIIKVSVGNYAYAFTPSGPGWWTYKWQGVGAVVATSKDTKFFVKASVFDTEIEA